MSDDVKKFTVRFAPELHKLLGFIAIDKGLSLGDLVVSACAEYASKHPNVARFGVALTAPAPSKRGPKALPKTAEPKHPAPKAKTPDSPKPTNKGKCWVCSDALIPPHTVVCAKKSCKQTNKNKLEKERRARLA